MAIENHLTPDVQLRHDAETSSARILIVDDVERERILAEGALTTVKGYEIQAADSAEAARQIAREWRPDVVILDIGMPDIDGIALARLLRAEDCDAELMFLTGDKKLDTKEEGLDIADQYLTKPYNTRELLAVIRVLLRNRRRHHTSGGQSSHRREVDALRPVFHPASDLVKIPRGKVTRLQGNPRRLLLALLAGEGKPVPTGKLYAAVWQADCDQERRPEVTPEDIALVHVTIKRLRSKIERDPSKPELIITVRGIGYYYNLTP